MDVVSYTIFELVNTTIPNIYIFIFRKMYLKVLQIFNHHSYIFLLLDLLIITTLKVLSYFIAIAVDVLGLII